MADHRPPPTDASSAAFGFVEYSVVPPTAGLVGAKASGSVVTARMLLHFHVPLSLQATFWPALTSCCCGTRSDSASGCCWRCTRRARRLGPSGPGPASTPSDRKPHLLVRVLLLPSCHTHIRLLTAHANTSVRCESHRYDYAVVGCAALTAVAAVAAFAVDERPLWR